MIFVLLTLMDVLVALVLVLSQLGTSLPWVVFVYAGSYMLGKGVLLWSNWMSWVDAAVGVWVLLLALGAHGIVSWVCVAWVCYKSVAALL